MLTRKFDFYRFLLFLLSLATVGCQQPASPPKNEPIIAGIDSAVSQVETDTIFTGTRDTVILLKNDEAFIRGHMTGNRHRLNYQMPAWKGQRVTAHLQPLSNGRVCFYQVKEPGQEPVGPLGDSVQVKLVNSGNVYFTVGDTQAKGKGYSGDFVLHILVQQ